MYGHAQAYARSCGVEDHRTSCIQVVDHEPITPQVSMVAIENGTHVWPCMRCNRFMACCLTMNEKALAGPFRSLQAGGGQASSFFAR